MITTSNSAGGAAAAAAAVAELNVLQAMKAYIAHMLSAPATGIKVLLLDTTTTSVVSAVSTHSALLAREVYLVDRLERSAAGAEASARATAPGERDRLPQLSCIVYARPTDDAIASLCSELRDPRFGSYRLYFANALRTRQIELLAEADVTERVTDLQEVFGDFLAVAPHLFSLGLRAPEWPVYADSLLAWNLATLTRTVEGLSSVLLSLRRRPAAIRYASSSPLAQRFAQEFHHYCTHTEPALFEPSRNTLETTLLILDRRSDPVTPLLMPWTYQAMVHELLGIENGLVDTPGDNAPGTEGKPRSDEKEGAASKIVLNHDDLFFAANWNQSFGDLGCAIKAYVQEFQQRANIRANIDTIADMKRFLDTFPEFKRLEGSVSKHVALAGELSSLVEAFKLLDVSEIEQNICCSDRDQFEAIQAALSNEAITPESKAKLVLLYTLRHGNNASAGSSGVNNATGGNTVRAQQAAALRRQLEAIVSPNLCTVIDYCLRYARFSPPTASAAGGAQSNNFSSVAGAAMQWMSIGSSDSTATSFAIDRRTIVNLGKNVLKGIKGVENVYTQYTPPAVEVIEALVRGRLRTSAYPFYPAPPPQFPQQQQQLLQPFQSQTAFPSAGTKANDVIVFIIGGITFEEARLAAQLRSSIPGLQLVVGGPTIHNSQSMLHQIHDTFSRWTT